MIEATENLIGLLLLAGGGGGVGLGVEEVEELDVGLKGGEVTEPTGLAAWLSVGNISGVLRVFG